MAILDFSKIIKAESKDSLIYVFSTFITGFGSFLIIPLYWSKLSLSDYGIIAVVEMISGFLKIFLGLNLEQGITRFYYEWNVKERKIGLGSLWLTSWGSVIFLFPIIFSITYFMSDFIFPSISFYPYIFLALILSFLSPLDQIPNATFRMLRKPLLYSITNIMSFILTNTFAIILVFVYDLGVLGYLYALIMSKIVMVIVYIVIMLKYAKPVIKRQFVKEPLRFSLNFIAPSLVSSITAQGDRYLLQLYMDIKFLGIYIIGHKFGQLFINVHSIIKLSFVPFLLENNPDSTKGKEVIKKLIPFYVFPLFLGFVGMSLFTDNLIDLIGNKDYFEVKEFLPWIFISLLIPSLYTYYAPGIYLSKKTKYLIYPAIASSLTFLACALILIPLISLNGLILSKIIAGVTYIAVNLHYSFKLYNWKNDHASSLFFVITSLLVVALDVFLIQYYNNIIVGFILICIFILISLIILKRRWKNINN